MLSKQMRFSIPAIFLLLFATGASYAADYDREHRWAKEIIPNIVVGHSFYLEGKGGHKFLAIFTQAEKPGKAVIVVHGMGLNPDWGLINILRTNLAERTYSTLSVQMPVLSANKLTITEYDSTLEEASDRLEKAVSFLKAKGYTKIAIVSHSMGARMANYYLAMHPATTVSAWAAIGMPGKFDDFGNIHIPILDLYGELDFSFILQNNKAEI